ncbi:MAG: acetate--CoA ligase [Longimicrobiales bacterium]
MEREQDLEALLTENRRFPPSPEFVRQANANDPSVYARAESDPEKFWADWAAKLSWFEPWKTVLKWSPPHAEWFVGGRLNASYNCLDRHLETRGDKTALVWEGEPGDVRRYTYRELHAEVCRCANALMTLGVRKGDRVAIYLPMIPEAAITMLACARIGAPHSVVFGGFSAESLRDRINDAQATVLVTADGGFRRGKAVALKDAADKAVAECPSIEHVLVVKRGADLQAPCPMTAGRDVWYHEAVSAASAACEAASLDAEDLLFILYTSGTTGKPKGVVHTTGGYLTHVYATTNLVFDLKEDDVYFCTADIGWVTGHSYVVYGPLANGATVLMYEGAPDWPNQGRFWDLIQTHGATILYTAPTAIRAFMRWGEKWPQKFDLSSLRLLGSVGEPINPEAWMWYHEHIGGHRCPIVDTWWQTETGGIMITPLPGLVETIPGSATIAFPGITADVITNDARSVNAGYLAIRKPWPGMLRTIYGDDERYRETYWSKWPDIYFPGDGAKRAEDGYYWILGRVDDVLNVAGHRIGTMEVESALVDHHSVAEAAVVGRADAMKGQAIAAFVTVKDGIETSDALRQELRHHVANKIGAIARPDDILFAADLPKTRSGKIMRRLLRDIAEGRALGDSTTLADPAVVARLKAEYEEKE